MKLFFRILFTCSIMLFIAESNGQALEVKMKNLTDSNFSYPSYHVASKTVVAQKRVGNYNQLFMINLQSNKVTQLTFDTAQHSHPRISPISAEVAYAKEINGQRDIWILDLNDPASQLNLTNTTSFSEAHPSWSYDGKKIFVNTNRYDSLQEVAEIDVITGAAKRITKNSEEDTYPSVSPDGKRLVYSKWFNNEKNPETYIMNLAAGTEERITDNNYRETAPVWISNNVITYTRSGHGKVEIIFYDINRKSETTINNLNGYFFARGFLAESPNTMIVEKMSNGKAYGLAFISF